LSLLKCYFKVKITDKASFLVFLMNLKSKKVVGLYCFLSLFLSACSGVKFSEWRFPYMYPVQQGNYITDQQLAQLTPGMTKDQVTFVIGHPVSQFMFNSNQWQYVYQNYKDNKLINSYIVNINFDINDRLTGVESAGSAFVK
jgi:outer membrane protein assembly factor BamE (lipoprotein component of BamABCDE complex)